MLSPPHVAKAVRELPNCQLINGYGPTENTTFTCCYRIPKEWSAGQSIPIGRPISNTRVYVLDCSMEPVPIGVPGELYAAGDGLALEYLNRPELTAERFISNPFELRNGSRLYRTGDIVRWKPDGNLEFLGRADGKTKIRGYRVECGEVEAVLSGHPYSGDSFGSRPRGPLHRQTACRVRCPGVLALRWTPNCRGNSCSRSCRLTWCPLGSWVSTTFLSPPNGKVDRRALPAPELSVEHAAECSALPGTALEKTIANIWCEILGPVPGAAR